MDASCLKYHIGISKQICDCLPDTELAEVTQSNSGLYVETLLSPLLRFKYKDCNTTEMNFWQKMVEQKNQSEKQAMSDFVTFNKRFQRLVPDAKSTIGDTSFSKTIYPEDDLAVFTFDLKKLTGASLILNRVGIVASQAKNNVEIDWYTYNDVDDTWDYVKTYTMNVKSASTETRPFINDDNEIEPIVLPLDGKKHQFSYATGDNFYPKNIKVSCGCTPDSKLFMISGKKAKGSLYFRTVQDYTNGFIFDVEIKCEMGQILCHLIKYDEFSQQIANLINYRFAIDMLDFILADKSKYNSIMALESNSLEETRDKYKEEYTAIIQNINGTKFDQLHETCYTCSQNMILANSKV